MDGVSAWSLQEPQMGVLEFRQPLLHEGFIGGPGPHVIPLQTAAGGLSVCIWLFPVAGGVISHEKTA